MRYTFAYWLTQTVSYFRRPPDAPKEWSRLARIRDYLRYLLPDDIKLAQSCARLAALRFARFTLVGF